MSICSSPALLPCWSGNRPMWTNSSSHPGRPFGDHLGRDRNGYLRSASGSSPYSSPSGVIGTKSYSGDASPSERERGRSPGGRHKRTEGRLLVGLVETIATPEEIGSNMGAAHEALVSVDQVSK